MSDFLSMGGYAAYVWTSYILVAVVLTANIVRPIMRHRAIVRSVARKGEK